MAEVIYAASGDIRVELNAGAPQGADSYKGEDEIRGAIITLSAERATRVIDGKLEKTYPNDVPWGSVASVPLLIVSIANDLSVYYVRRSKHPGPGPMSDDVKEEYWDKPMEMLDAMAAGAMELPELASSTSVDEVSSSTEGYISVFDMDDVINQEVDPSRLDDIADSKLD